MNRTRYGAVVLGLAALTSCDKSPTEPQGAPVSIAWAPCTGSPDAPAWFAVQNGTTGTWTAVPATSGVFNFVLTAGRGGVAYYVAPTLNVIYGTTDEIKAFAPSCAGALRSVSGTVTGYTALDAIDVDLGSGSASVQGTAASPASITLAGVEPTAAEVVAVRSRSTVTISFVQTTPNSVLIRRSVTGNALAALDLNSSTEASAPLSRLVTVSGAASGEEIDVLSELTTASTRSILSSYQAGVGAGSGSASAPFSGLPASRLVAGELQELRVKTSKQTTPTTVDSRYITTAYTDVLDQTLTLGPVLTPPSISGTARPTVSYTVQTGYDKLWDFSLDQSNKSIDIIMTSGYLSGVPTSVSISVPDLSAAAGFSTDWLMTTGTSTSWSFFASNGDLQTLNGKLGSYQAGLRESTFVP